MVSKVNMFAWLSWGNTQSTLGVVGELLGNSRSLDSLDAFHEKDYNFWLTTPNDVRFFCIENTNWCSFFWCTHIAPSLYHMGVAHQNIRGKNWQHQLHLKLVSSKLFPPKRLLQKLIGCWISSMWYLSSTNNNGDESAAMWSRLWYELKLAFTWPCVCLIRLSNSFQLNCAFF